MDTKEALGRYLAEQRSALLLKVDGLSERDARLPRTPTGTNLIGIVKHCMNVEYGYFGPTFGRTLDDPSALVPDEAYDSDPQADWYATADETVAGILDTYREVQAFCDETIASLPLEAPGRVPWWGDRGDVTLGRVLVHVIADLARHAGHADILREQLDGAVGDRAPGDNVPDVDFAAYVAKLTELADRS
ncbi:DinB family protein [Nocardioides panacisoli]